MDAISLAAGADAFEAALDADPADHALRLVYADWLEENGDPHGAEATRWLGATGRRPVYFADADDWGWVASDCPEQANSNSYTSYVPRWFGLRIASTFAGEEVIGRYRIQKTRRGAEDALRAAWRSLPESGRQRLLRGASA